MPHIISCVSDVQGIYLFTSGVPDQLPDVVLNYIGEASSGHDLRLHTILFNVDDYDAHGAIPGRYANITGTAECLRNMAHISGGRFHWFRETGKSGITFISEEVSILHKLHMTYMLFAKVNGPVLLLIQGSK